MFGNFQQGYIFFVQFIVCFVQYADRFICHLQLQCQFIATQAKGHGSFFWENLDDLVTNLEMIEHKDSLKIERF
uniref:Putative secreted peptide n=1 Tax=Anopheles braziliensis TaxID=58242 RepID=A0A2M3ZXJ6_9DIPT